MANYDARIILAGQPVNMLGALQAGNEAAAFQRDALHTRDYRNMLQTNGAGIMAGDQGALNALAGYDPSAALGIQSTQQDMGFAQQRMDMLTAQEKRAAEEYARGLSKEQAAAEAAQLEGAVKQALMLPDAATWDAFMAQNGMTDLVGQFDNRQALAGKFMSMAEVLKQVFPEAPAPTPDQKNYQFYADQESQAGRTPLSFNDWTMQRKKAGAPTTTVTVNGDGPGEREATVGDVYTPGAVTQAIELIDEISSDPALKGVVGSIEGGGGNNPDELGIAARAYYGDKGMGVIAKINQLQSQSWMAARAMLKGGGQITDYESRKAEAAVARLTRAQGEAEFRAALKDLRDAITDGMAKLETAKGGATTPPAEGGLQPGAVEDGYRFKGGDPADPNNWEQVQ